MFEPLLTKLNFPQVSAVQVPRLDLLNQLTQGVRTARLTLISAQAGAGKTTLLGQWIASSPGLEIIWLSLDSADNDPTRFWSYVVTAFSAKLPALSEIGPQLLGMLQTPQLVSQPLPVESILTELINAILRQPASVSKDICLILDDYHLVENRTIHQALAGLLDFSPPNLHLLIASRSDPELPLARLRVRGQLLELRPEVLRFNSAEATTFYNTTMHLGLSAAQIAALEKRTEGWAAGMQLLALSLQPLNGPKREEFIRSFSGTNRYIIDYLVQEIVENLPEAVQKFLLQTSILERLNGELCAAVLRPEASLTESDGEAGESQSSQAMLESLASENLFVSRLDEQGEWFRYHQLFAAVLQNRLNRTYPLSLRQTLHRRAANWFASQGRPEEAVKHYFATQDYQDYIQAAELLVGSLSAWWQRGELLSLVSWIEKLPEQVRQKYPVLELTRAWPVVLTGQLERVLEILQGLEGQPTTFEPGPGELSSAEAAKIGAVLPTVPQFSPDLQAQVDFLKGYLAVASSRWAEAIRYFEVALSDLATKIEPGRSLPWWLLALTSLGWAYRFIGQPAQARAVYDRAIALCRANRDFLALVATLSYRTELDEEAGQLREAGRVYQGIIQEGEEKLGASLPRLYMSGLYAGLGRVCYSCNELEEAESCFKQALYYSRLDQNLPVIVQALEGLARIALAQNETGRAFGLLDELQEEARAEHLDELRQHFGALRAQFQLRQGQLTEATTWAETLLRRYPDYLILPPVHLREIRVLTLARVWLALGQTARVQPLLAWQLEVALAANQQSKVLEIYLLQALAYYPQPEAYTHLEKALALAVPENCLRIFLDEGRPALKLLQGASAQLKKTEFVNKLLAAFADLDPAPTVQTPNQIKPATPTLIQGQFEPLSEREKEVLNGLAAGLSNRALADKLIVTENTVKVHVRNIFAKLDVNSRTQALLRAKELGLL